MVSFSFVTANGSKVVDTTPLPSMLEGKNLGCIWDRSVPYFSCVFQRLVMIVLITRC